MTAQILVVDDEPDFRALMERRFRKEIRSGEMEFAFAENGNEALEIVENGSGIDVVLSDINMPGMDGLELLEQLQRFDTKLKTIMVSAYGDMENIRRAMNGGAFDFVTKPIDFSDLRVTIEKTLQSLAVLRDAIRHRAEAEQARANLSRYFPPNMVETLANENNPFAKPRSQPAAVMFADIIGFTAISAGSPPEKVFELLRRFHRRMAQEIFACGGTLDKYIGDGLMASFGTPETGEQDAARALCCAVGMVGAMGEINAGSAAGGEPEIRVAIGLHYGPVLLGNIGDERRLEFATIGDTVNIASRLERLARPLQADIVVSDAVVTAIRDADGGNLPELDGFKRLEPQEIRGIDDPMVLWVAPGQAP